VQSRWISSILRVGSTPSSGPASNCKLLRQNRQSTLAWKGDRLQLTRGLQATDAMGTEIIFIAMASFRSGLWANVGQCHRCNCSVHLPPWSDPHLSPLSQRGKGKSLAPGLVPKGHQFSFSLRLTTAARGYLSARRGEENQRPQGVRRFRLRMKILGELKRRIRPGHRESARQWRSPESCLLRSCL
jgi:hypothetical protein